MDIVFFGGHYWDRGAWFRKQQFAKRFAERGHRVFYVEESVSMIRRKNSDKNEYWQTKVQEINDNLYVITPSATFPYPNNFFSRKLSNMKLNYDLKNILKAHGVKDYLFWLNRLEFSSELDSIKGTKVIDLCDDLPFYAKLVGEENIYRLYMKYLANILAKTDIQIASAQKIKEKYNHLSKSDMIVVPNGHNIKIDHKTKHHIPDDLKGIKRPIIGYLGTLFQFTDGELLEFLIKQRPGYSFVFIGGTGDNFPLEKIKYSENVFLLGKKPKDDIPAYINSFDVCINTFKIHEVNDSVNPVKVFEYLALKKPVVSTNMYSLMKETIADYISFAETYDSFLENIDCIVREKKFVNNIPDEVIENYHWDNLFTFMINQIKTQHRLEL